MIVEEEEIRDLFHIFHDGYIEEYTYKNGNLTLKIRIDYLANIYNKDNKYFILELYQLSCCTFFPWPRDFNVQANPINDINEILKREIQILSGGIKEDK